MEFSGAEHDFQLAAYEKLLLWLEPRAELFAFVTRSDIGVNHYKKALIKQLEPYLVQEERINSWFLNEVSSYKIVGHVYYYRFNKKSLTLLLNHSNSLFDWGNNKKLPEDLTFLNKNKEFIFGCNGHEYYYEVSEKIEKDFLRFKKNDL